MGTTADEKGPGVEEDSSTLSFFAGLFCSDLEFRDWLTKQDRRNTLGNPSFAPGFLVSQRMILVRADGSRTQQTLRSLLDKFES